MMVIVVTGGIGSGKSEVCRILKDMGFRAQYNADMRAKALYEEHPALLADIEKSLGCSLKDENGHFVPAKLAARIFTDPESLEIVEAHLFPVMMADFASYTEHCGEEIVVFESATVLEKTYFEGFGDKVILVDAPFETRLERACRRDGADREKVLARMRNQQLMNALSEGLIDPRIDAVILNDGSMDQLQRRTKEEINSLISK
jgi:dephospho-CoA kinase